MKQSQRIAIDMAAAGCISGTVDEWPLLRQVLRELGHEIPDGTPYQEVVALCRDIEVELRQQDRANSEGRING